MRVMKWLTLAWLAVAVLAGSLRFLVKVVPVSLNTIELVYWMFQVITVLVWTAMLGVPALLVGWAVALATRGRRAPTPASFGLDATPPPPTIRDGNQTASRGRGGRWLT